MYIIYMKANNHYSSQKPYIVSDTDLEIFFNSTFLLKLYEFKQ